MLHNIGQEIYHCEFTPAPPTGADYLLCYRKNEILLTGEGAGELPQVADFPEINPAKLPYLFDISRRRF